MSASAPSPSSSSSSASSSGPSLLADNQGPEAPSTNGIQVSLLSGSTILDPNMQQSGARPQAEGGEDQAAEGFGLYVLPFLVPLVL
jgi:hypothetical protein